MKTIEEACLDFVANSDCGIPNEEMDDYNAGYLTGATHGFEVGVEFAQRWISVDEELPELNKAVLIKNKTGVGIGSRYSGKSFIGKGFFQLIGEVTHWRQIELK
jgi:hypothetical protein